MSNPPLSARCEWMSSKIQVSFAVDKETVDKCLTDNKKKIDAFMQDMTVPPKLFFFFQPRQFKKPELFCSLVGDGDKLEGKCVYFVRCSTKPIKDNVTQDQTVLFGEVNKDILQVLETTLSEVFNPLLKAQPEWGLIKLDKDKQAFIDQLSKFDNDLKHKIANLRGDLELRAPESPHDKIEQKPAAYARAAKDPEVLKHFQGIVTSWCDQITKYMEDDPSNQPIAPKNDSGPDVEIEYWSRRMLTLISITEQLKTKPSRVVTGVLKARALRSEPEDNNTDENAVSEQERIKNLIERWREVDLAITDSLNESKDNVRFLENLRKVIEPLYTDTPKVIADAMPSLMNSMKMIHTLSRHYGTEVRMTNLFERITNQLIARCKNEVYSNQNVSHLWKQNPKEVMEKMNSCIALCETYRQYYQDAKDKLAEMPKGKQFNFDENAIFGKLTRFRRRVEKLIDMFSSIEQFKALREKRIDSMEPLLDSFDELVNEFKIKGHDLLDFYNTVFERDFVEFAMRNSQLENAIQNFMERSLSQMSSIDKQLDLLQKFKDVLHREALKDDLHSKYIMVFKIYGEELHEVQHTYEKHKQNPPIPRNMTRIAGNIHWSRQLLRHITEPMRAFMQNARVFHSKESKKIVTHYNKLARILIEFERLYYLAFQKSTDQAKKGLRKRILVQDPNTKELRVNFDAGVIQLIREAKHMQIMDLAIPDSGKIVLLMEDKLKAYYHDFCHALERHREIVRKTNPVCRSLLKPHFMDLQQTINPALVTLTWSSMNIGPFITNLHNALSRFEYLITMLNDIIDNRVTVNLRFVSTLLLLHLPKDKSFSNKEFVDTQKRHIGKMAEILAAKNTQIERAVDDIVDCVQEYELSPDIARTDDTDINLLKLHYSNLVYNALLTSTKNSLKLLKDRIECAKGSPLLDGAAPVFEVNLSLQVPNVTLSPSLPEIHEAVNGVARDVLQCTRQLMDWGIDATARPRSPKPFYEKLAADKNLAIVLLLLTGSMEKVKVMASSHMSKYDHYKWLWMEDPEETYNKFVEEQQPILEDFIQELNRFVKVEEDVMKMAGEERMHSMLLKTDHLKQQLKHESERWKFQYSEKLHKEAKRDMDAITEKMADLKVMLNVDVKDLPSLDQVMNGQVEVREVQSSVQSTFSSIIERYNTLEMYLPTGGLGKDEMDAKSVLKTQWDQILSASSKVREKTAGLQDNFKTDLVDKVRLFKKNVKAFRQDYNENGPMVKGTSPKEAMVRLKKYKREFETLTRKYDLYNGGEKLFGLPEMKYPELVATAKEIRLLDQLYGLYSDVINTVEEYKDIPWTDVVENITNMKDTVEGFSARCKKFPRALKQWDAYLELNSTIENFLEILPLLEELAKESMRPRHWEAISELTGTEFDMERFAELKLKSVLEANLLEFREDIEEITDSAEKQLGIEKKLFDIEAIWQVKNFSFGTWKERGDVILAGSAIADVIEALEESQSALVQMLTQRHVTPFREHATSWLKKLSDVNDSLDIWIKVQMLWMSLEAVFTGGDIARQMPQDTRVFMKVDKEWTTRMMAKAKDVLNVVECCQNEYIKAMLPSMIIDLEKCQKALDGYLEAKRNKFPRFYFVSNPALLLILSQGSDKEACQQCFAKIFDSIERVDFSGNNIVKIKSLVQGTYEDISLSKEVSVKGNIEDWLALLLKEHMRTMKDLVRQGAVDYEAMSLTDFINTKCSQISLLGIQFMWTADVQDAIVRCKNEKTSLATAQKKQTQVLTDLSAMTTGDIKTKLDRTKIETLVTIQVHQKEVLESVVKKYKEKKLKDVHDFLWQCQLRCEWVPENDECYVRIADVDFAYCYEYLGCKERLCVTPLTDRCYITLSQALGMNFGGAPAGPAGTGKTETVKDLGRALGKYVVVFNCSDQMHTADTAKIYKGLCMSGSWGCFDEFNRIDLEVLSVVAQQVEAILGCIRARQKQFSFPGDDIGPIQVDTRCGFFITMNPGYAGRQELPENLKALFRSMAMMVPDREIIIKVKLASVGYNDFAPLAMKFRVLYGLCEEQLSKQRHYDFGLRNILSVLRTAGVNLRIELTRDPSQERHNLEEMLMMRTLRDMNLSKLVSDDVSLFIALLHDLFPNQADPEKRRYDEEEDAMNEICDEKKLIKCDTWPTKAVQLYETSLVRHGLMMIGPAGSGKTAATELLLDSLTKVKEKTIIVKMNPKAIKAEEMFGNNDIISGEWTHGIFSSIWQKYNDAKKAHNTWIICDGPVDAIWIENLNTVLDDNKLLTLANGDRLPMTDNVRILFEAEDLRNASPATVSRAGIVFVSAEDLGFEPVVDAWINSRREDEGQIIKDLYTKYVVEPELNVWIRNNTESMLSVTMVHLITNMLALIESLLADSVRDQVSHPGPVLERIFVYAVAWSLGGLLETEDRKKLSQKLKDLCGDNFAPCSDKEDIYSYFVSTKTWEWEAWVAPEWEFDPELFKFETSLVPTVDSTRAEHLIDLMLNKLKKPVLVIGSSGTAKTSLVLQYMSTFDPTKNVSKRINFSSATTMGMFQVSMEADIEKRQGKTYAPSGGRTMTCFLDDVSMPEVNAWGDQPTLEIVRQIVEDEGFYFLEKDRRGDKMTIENVVFIGAMSHPGGGRNDIPNRLKRHFYAMNMTPPSHSSIDNIFGSMMRGRLGEGEGGSEELVEVVPQMVSATIDLWYLMKAKMLPTPAKFHYVFNMRDLSRSFQGMLNCPNEVLKKDINYAEIWFHECERVFCDKLTNDKDKKFYLDNVKKIAANHFPEEVLQKIYGRSFPIYFVDYLRDDVIDEETDEVLEAAPKVYEPVIDLPAMKARVVDMLSRYNEQPGTQKMNLVLFEDALQHMMRISRIIGMPRGNALLVGVGGSGRQSLTRLAAFVARHVNFQIKLSRTYKVADFLDDIRKMYTMVGKEGKKLTWVFTDFEIINENFLEYINAILATGEIAGLFAKDERDMMCSDLRGPAKKEDPNFDDTPDNLYKYFLERIRSNLHIVLCFSPANDKFAERARKFPSLIAGNTIDWFLRWPEQALIDVSDRFLTADKDFIIEGTAEVKTSIVGHIAAVHNLVTENCLEYFTRYRRSVYVTPKSYLSFIKSYKDVYKAKLIEKATQERNVTLGLSKLKDAEIDVDKMKGVLEKQNVELKVADAAATEVLKQVEIGTKEANIKKAEAAVIEEKCSKTAATIDAEKAEANRELEAAMPFVHAATDAAKAVTKKDVGIITKLGKPPDLIKRIMDCVLLLLQRPLDPVELTEIKTDKTSFEMFITDSYDTQSKKVMQEVDFCNSLLNFATTEKDKINDETMEFLEPYLRVKDFNPERARGVASAAEGLCKWTKAMYSYHIAALIVGPKLEQLELKQSLFDVAMAKLRAAQNSSAAAQAEVDRLQAQFEATMKEKTELERKAKLTADKMIAANNLIASLGGEKVRWSADAKNFANEKRRLVGDCALACAFVSYLGPFNQVFRKFMIDKVFMSDLNEKNIPVSSSIEVTSFLVDAGTVAEWNSQGLPKDDLSVQNGILVTQASRFPLLVDPQGQAISWLKKREMEHFPVWGTTTLSNPKLRDQLEFCMDEGKPLLIEGVVKEVDPMLDPVLEKNIMTKGRSQFIILGDKPVNLDPKFRMYLTTKLPNPFFSPELSAKTTIIDFSVTQKGLEDQLLSRVIQQEQKSLEDQRQALIEEVNMNTISLQALDKQLLDRLSASSGNLLDDIELIGVLADTKTKAQEVGEKIAASDATQVTISKKREQYRPVATRGSVVYFVITSMANVNCMYQTSLAQFLGWFDGSLHEAEKANLVAKRVENLMSHLTFNCYINIDRGLFEVDKMIFKLMVTTSIQLEETPDILNQTMVQMLLRGGAALNIADCPKKPFDWITVPIWLNICAMSSQVDFFSDLRALLEQNEGEFKRWYESEAPEETEVPTIEDKLKSHPSGPMMRLLLVRAFRDDRLRLSSAGYVGSVLGRRYVEPVALRIEDIWGVSRKYVPVIMLLTPGADPTAAMQDLAKKKGLKIRAVSMGEGQEKFATRAIEESMREGGWAVLQNCHLGLGYMNQIDENLRIAEEEERETPVHDEFRLWITCEPHDDFPINLLQMGIKVTNEPPAGLKAGLFRSYTSVVDAERLGRVETKEWRDLVWCTCFLHSVVQERRKFGAIGWCIPYEYNTGDQEASLTFLEKHSFSAQGLNWETIQYMLCEAQYGGRITDDFDRILFKTFGNTWLTPDLFSEGFRFAKASGSFEYIVPPAEAIEECRSFVSTMPAHDSPEVFGLHVNADLTFGTTEGRYIVNTINDTRPKDTSAAKGAKTREELVIEKCDELLAQMPKTYSDDMVRDMVRKRSKAENEFVLGHKLEERVDGFTIPLNVFLYQEIVRITAALKRVKTTLTELKLAINGEVIMTPELSDALNMVFDSKPPVGWYKDASGAEIAWTLPTLALWFQGLLDRETQLLTWLNSTRPTTYWLTGFFNPQGFLTAARQEVTRRHKAEKWALDDVVLKTNALNDVDHKRIKVPPPEGVYVHGLYLEGCSWEKSTKMLKEAAPKELFTPFPVLHITAVTSEKARKIYGPSNGFFYDCPCYTKPRRTGLAYVFTVKVPSEVHPDHWVLRGVALLCSKD